MEPKNEKATETPKFNFENQAQIVRQVLSEKLSPNDQIERFKQLQNGVGLALTGDGNEPTDKVQLHDIICSFGVDDVSELYTFLWNRNGGSTLPRQSKNI